MLEKTFKLDIDSLHPILIFIANYAEKKGFEEKIIKKIELAVEEIVVNIWQHSYKKQPLPISIQLLFENETLQITIQDQGPYFNLLEYPQKNKGSMSGEGGAGIILIRSMVKDMRYQRMGDNNSLTLMIPK